MLDESARHLIEATAQILQLEPNVVEKDYYVTYVLNILANIKHEHFTLVFAGGTCLAKAHRLVNRMSEDIDFKLQTNVTHLGSSKNQRLKALKAFRDQIVFVLEKTELKFKETVVRNEGNYLCINLEYPSLFLPNSVLRPHLLVEFTASKLQLSTQRLFITTLIQDTLGKEINLIKPYYLNCISIEETAAEKWVGLTRRIAAIDCGYYEKDNTLIRHMYDLAAIYTINSLGDKFFKSIKKIISNDAKQFKNQHPEYFSNAIQEIKKSLSFLKTDLEWSSYYDTFLETMVYDKNPIQYQDAAALFGRLSEQIITAIQ